MTGVQTCALPIYKDVDGDTLTVTAVTQPSSGTATVNPGGTITYAPAASFSGTDTFTYTISDGHGGSSTATVTVTVVGNATRTQGFWATHFDLASKTWLSIHSPDRIIGTKNLGDGTNDVKEMEGGFWSDVAKKSDGKTRTALDQARMQLLQQLLAAMLNKQAFGTDDHGLIAAGKAAFSGTDSSVMLSAASSLDSFNNSGDTQPLPAGIIQGKADPKTSQSNADKTFWNILP